MKKFETLEDLNANAEEVEKKLAAIEAEAVKKSDIELVNKDNAELKAELEATQKILEEIKEAKMEKVENLSQDDKYALIGRMALSLKRNDYSEAYKLNLRQNLSESPGEGNWNVKSLAAPDLGTPLRGDAVTGSYLVPDEIAAQILRYNPSPSALMGRVTDVRMSSRTINYPTLATNVGWTMVTNEVTAKTESVPVFGNAVLTAETYAFWAGITEELREDAVINVGQFIAQLGTEQWRYTFDNEFINKTTTGLLNVAGTNAESCLTGHTTVSDFSYADAQLVPAALDTQGKRVGSGWLMHTTVQDVMRSWVDDGGRPYFVDATDTMPAQLLGYPIYLSDAMPDATSVGAGEDFIAFGPMSKLLHGERVGLEVRYFANTADTLVYDREYIRLRTRQAFTVGLPGNFVILATAAV